MDTQSANIIITKRNRSKKSVTANRLKSQTPIPEKQITIDLDQLSELSSQLRDQPIIDESELFETTIDDELFKKSQTERTPENENDESTEPSVNDEAKKKILELMRKYLKYKQEIADLNELKKEKQRSFKETENELSVIMKFYGLGELIIDDRQFLLGEMVRKTALKKPEFRQKLEEFFKNKEVVDQAYKYAENSRREVTVERLRCLKYKPPKKN